tara:strand:+ start:1414 stop:1824 length:411 start_codon:yes stop_codon:yes gene_type:complete
MKTELPYTPDAFAAMTAELLMPFVGMLMIIIISLMIKDFATKLSKGLAFSMNKQFKEGDHVLLDDESALIVKIGLVQTVFGVNKDSGDYIWRYVPNERISYLKLEKVVFSATPESNGLKILQNSEDIQEIKETAKR